MTYPPLTFAQLYAACHHPAQRRALICIAKQHHISVNEFYTAGELRDLEVKVIDPPPGDCKSGTCPPRGSMDSGKDFF